MGLANALSVGRSTEEVLRVLEMALQSDELCPCNWKKGDATIKGVASPLDATTD